MDYSIICPFYNEAEIIEQAVQILLDKLSMLNGQWELIVVNDGSTDESEEIVAKLVANNSNLHLISYARNRGRGHALRTGIAAATGEIIVTTEIDLSWGEDIVHDLIDAMKKWPDADIVVASPNLPGGDYKNVPFRRVFVSRLGNLVIRALMSNAMTMNTGMTRAYRREIIQSMPLFADHKEFHLEVILKAVAFGYRMGEIPAVLEWKEYKHKGSRIKRKSSSKVNRLVISHSLFSLFANPVRYVWTMSLIALILSFLFFLSAVILFLSNLVSVFSAIISLVLGIIAILFFVLGVVLQQGSLIQRELWILQRSFHDKPTIRTGMNLRENPVEVRRDFEAVDKVAERDI